MTPPVQGMVRLSHADHTPPGGHHLQMVCTQFRPVDGAFRFSVVKNCMLMFCCHMCREVRLGPINVIAIDDPFKGRGVGGYLLSRTITAMQPIAAGYRVVPEALSSDQARLDAERDRRNQFYAAQGFQLWFSEAQHEQRRQGKVYADSIDTLRPNLNPDRIVELGFHAEIGARA